MSEEKKPNGFRFDDVAIDRRNFRILKNGEPRRLTPRAFELLLFLIENAGRVVGKQEFFDSIWKESFVTDNALTRIVKEIRRVRGDAADAPRYIETVHKRGYRFIAQTRSIYCGESAPKDENPIDSIAVLPFKNVGPEAGADGEYLGEAITESVVHSLSEIPVLRVVPRSVVFSLAAMPVPPKRVVNFPFEQSPRSLLN